MQQFTYHAPNVEATERLGQALALVSPPGTTIGLCGTLGAGKTRLVQAIAVACGVLRSEVVSPTFVLCHEYYGTRTIYHLDAYRLRDSNEFLELGPEEFFDSSGLTLVEWADRVLDCLPPERLEVQITVTGPDSRTFEVVAHGQRYDNLLAGLATALSADDASHKSADCGL